MSRFAVFFCSLLGILALPICARADSYWFSAVPDSVNVADGTVSSTVNVYLNSDTAFYGIYASYVQLNVQLGGNATLNSDDYNHAYDFPFIDFSTNPPSFGIFPGGSATVSPSFGEITDDGLFTGPTGPVTQVLLGSFDVFMPLGGTTTTVTLDEDPAFVADQTTGSPVVIYTDQDFDTEAVLVTSGSAIFNPEASTAVPLPSAAWGGLGLLAILGLTRKSRKLVLA